MKDEKIIEQAVAYIQKLFRTNAGGHDVDHTMRVYPISAEDSRLYRR
jgi:HD superfamily phosphodiesterase